MAIEGDNYNIWKKYTSFLYDFPISHALECPSPTVQWLPDRVEPPPPGGDHSVQKLILGTDLLCGSPNYLLLAEVHLLLKEVEVGDESEVANKGLPLLSCFLVKGVGISWSPVVEGYLLTSADHGIICLWDTRATLDNKLLGHLHVFQGHDGVVEDVALHLRHGYVFGSVGDDHHLQLWDLRTAVANKPIPSVVAHVQVVDCLAFNPFNEWILISSNKQRRGFPGGMEPKE